MPVHTPTPGAIVVVAGEDDRFDDALRRAIEVASEARRPLILYDWDAPSLFSEPLPTWWSSEGWDRRVPDRLDETQLDAAGRGSLAQRVRRARATGVEAFGWLPSDHGPGALAEYASGQGASTIVIPRGLAELDGLEALVNGSTRPAEVVADLAPATVVVA